MLNNLQRERISILTNWFLENIPRYWPMEEARNWAFPDFPKKYLDNYQQTVVALEHQWGDELGLMMADFFMYPLECGLHAFWRIDEFNKTIGKGAYAIVKKWLTDNKRPEIFPALGQRIKHMLGNLSINTEITPEEYEHWSLELAYYDPRLNDCFRILKAFDDHKDVQDIALHVVRGDWNQSLEGQILPKGEEGSHSYSSRYCAQILFSYQRELLQSLFDAGLLDYELYAGFARLLPRVVSMHLDPSVNITNAYRCALNDYATRLCWESVVAHDPLTFSFLNGLDGARLPGSRWLLKACEYIEAQGLQLDATQRYDSAQRPIINMAGIPRFEEGDDLVKLEAELRNFSRSTLLSVLPFSECAQDIVLRALNLEKMIDLRHWIARSVGVSTSMSLGCVSEFDIDKYKGFGKIDIKATEQLVKQTGEKAALEFMKLLKSANPHLLPVQSLLEAVLGKNRKRHMNLASKFNLRALVLLGLFPFDTSESALDHYCIFKQILRDSRRFGSARRNEIAIAIENGLKHLASRAGFTELIEFERAMEAQLPLETSLYSERSLDEWQVEICISSEVPELIVSKQGKRLKTAPAALKKNPDFLAMHKAYAELVEHRQQLRATLEAFMVEGFMITRSNLALMHSVPADRVVLQGLLFRTVDGRFGLYDQEGECLLDHNGHSIELSDSVAIAHAVDLMQADLLSAWKTVLAKRALAPMEQLSRPIYTIADLGGDVQCGSGTVIDTRKASALLNCRGWVLGYNDDAGDILRYFKHKNIKVQMVFTDSGRFLAENPQATFDMIAFIGQKRIDFQDVPPAIFSETWRDVKDMLTDCRV